MTWLLSAAGFLIIMTEVYILTGSAATAASYGAAAGVAWYLLTWVLVILEGDDE